MDAIPAANEAEAVKRAGRDMQERLNRVQKKLAEFWESRGVRYAQCSLDNFICGRADQRQVISDAWNYIDDVSDSRKKPSQNILLFGPCGTGKDHILSAMAGSLISTQLTSIKWICGVDLYGQLRDAMDDSKTSEVSIMKKLCSPDVLYISDPLPPKSNEQLTSYQSSFLFRVIDSRYNNCKAVWCSLNVANNKEAETRLGVATVDRLRHDALCIHCNWPSYRKVSNNLTGDP